MLLTHIVSSSEDGLTLQAMLREPMGLSSRQAAVVKRSDNVRVDGRPMFSNQRVREGQRICVALNHYKQPTASTCPKQNVAVQKARAGSLRVLYEDDVLIAVFKPAMLQSHPSPSAPAGSDTLEARVCAVLGIVAHPVHRLDTQTSGIVLFAKCPYAQAHLQRQLQTGSVHKEYLAWVYDMPQPNCGVINAPIARSAPESFTRVVRADGKHAISQYETMHTMWVGHSKQPISLVKLRPVTGRTHQLRVHMAHIGCHLLGDMRYFSKDSEALSRELSLSHQQLCNVFLQFTHPLSHERISLSCDAEFEFTPH